MKSIWNGAITFGLVYIPVKVYAATEEGDVKFHQVHDKDGGRIRYKRVCEDCGEVVEYRDLAKQYEFDDQKVVVTNDDLAELEKPQHRVMDVSAFVPTGKIDMMMYDKPYYILPNKSLKFYRVLTEAIKLSRRVAVVQITLRSKTRLAVLKVEKTAKGKDLLVAYTLRWPDEVRVPDFPELDDDVKVDENVLSQAAQMISALAKPFHAEEYRDTYADALYELLEAKAGEVEVADLLAKLEASICKEKETVDG